MQWYCAPRPKLSPKSYNEWWAKGSHNDRVQWLKESPPKFVTGNREEILFDAADVLRFGRDLFIQHGCTTNLKGIQWIQRQCPHLRVHPVNFPDDPWPTHIDAVLMPLRPGLALYSPARPLPAEQAALFHEHGWDLLPAAQPAHKHPPAGCASPLSLSMNMLSLDHDRVFVEATEVHQIDQLRELGLEPVPVPFRDAYLFGGGLHCSSADVYREGHLASYFADMPDL